MKPKYKILLGAIVLLLIFVALSMFGFNKKKNQPTNNNSQIVETKTFSCKGMEGFTFEYPVFKDSADGYPKVLGSGNQCNILLKPPTKTKPTPTIKIIKDYQTLRVAGSNLPVEKNINGVPYDEVSLKDGSVAITFYGPDFAVRIRSIDSVLTLPSQFFKTVIDSFRLTGNKITKEQAINLVWDYLVKNNPAIISVGYEPQPHAEQTPDGWIVYFEPGPNNQYFVDSKTHNVIKQEKK